MLRRKRFKVGLGQFRKLDASSGAEDNTPRTDRNLPLPILLAGLIIVAVVMAAVPQVFGGLDDFAHRAVAAVCVVLFAFFFVRIAFFFFM